MQARHVIPACSMTDLATRKDTVKTLPASLWHSLTWDRGKELSDYARLTRKSAVRVFFAAPRSPWPRGTNENTNGLLRQYFPKGTDLSRCSDQEIQAVAPPEVGRLRFRQSGGVSQPVFHRAKPLQSELNALVVVVADVIVQARFECLAAVKRR